MTDPIAPDLAAILATLSQHTGFSGRQADTRQSHTRGTPLQQSQQGSQAHLAHPVHPAYHQNTSQAAPRTAPTDPSRITSWPAALRYTSSLLASQPVIAARVKKLISSQHEHERTWWTGRQTLLLERAKRVQGRKAVNDVLRALGGRVVDDEAKDGVGAGQAGQAGGVSDEQVYAEYDAKVYRAAADMVADVRRQLKEMGIPGFVVRPEMVGAGHGRISKEDVRELEARVLVLLGDLCKE